MTPQHVTLITLGVDDLERSRADIDTTYADAIAARHSHGRVICHGENILAISQIRMGMCGSSGIIHFGRSMMPVA